MTQISPPNGGSTTDSFTVDELPNTILEGETAKVRLIYSLSAEPPFTAWIELHELNCAAMTCIGCQCWTVFEDKLDTDHGRWLRELTFWVPPGINVACAQLRLGEPDVENDQVVRRCLAPVKVQRGGKDPAPRD